MEYTQPGINFVGSKQEDIICEKCGDKTLFVISNRRVSDPVAPGEPALMYLCGDCLVAEQESARVFVDALKRFVAAIEAEQDKYMTKDLMHELYGNTEEE